MISTCLIQHKCYGRVDLDHIRTRGSGHGDVMPDGNSNVWPLCRLHHTEKGAIGICSFIKKHRVCMEWLIDNNRLDVIEMCEYKENHSA